jgi:regulator of protease activity HflC (stomatin/prohibitin superfamily)
VGHADSAHAKSVSYEVASSLQAIEQLTVTTLRNVIGGLTLGDVDES